MLPTLANNYKILYVYVNACHIINIYIRTTRLYVHLEVVGLLLEGTCGTHDRNENDICA